eukprot:1681314-Pleurochrysis_carterae.AAC.2
MSSLSYPLLVKSLCILKWPLPSSICAAVLGQMGWAWALPSRFYARCASAALFTRVCLLASFVVVDARATGLVQPGACRRSLRHGSSLRITTPTPSNASVLIRSRYYVLTYQMIVFERFKAA